MIDHGMRLFLGIDLPEPVARAAAAIAERLKNEIARAAPRAALRWVPAENLHITVWFLGEVQEPRADALAAALRPGLDVPPFSLRIAAAGAFPGAGAPRVLWLGLPEGRAGLLAVHDRLRPRLGSLGFEPEKRPYDPHLTIARVKDVPRPEIAAVRAILADTRSAAGEFRVEAVTLFKSRTSPHGAQYERLFRVPLE
jgi:2'-5' RNA ligase